MTTSYAPILEPTDDQVAVHIDPADAKKLITRLRKVSIYVRTSVDLMTEFYDDGKPTRCYPDMGGNVPISARVANKMMDDLIRFNERKASIDQATGTVKLTRLGHCLFIG